MKNMAVALLLAAVLAGCASVARIEGDQLVNGKLAIHVSDAWNKVEDPWEDDPYDTWTREGLPLDHLRFWGGVREGQALMTRPMVYLRSDDQRARRVPTFRAGLTPEKLVSLFEELYSNAGAVSVTRMDPAVFVGHKAVRFEFIVHRRRDDLTLRGVGWATVRRDPTHGDELYAATFVAPRLAFYERLLPAAEAVVATARIRPADTGRR
jgi:hypothetical protein